MANNENLKKARGFDVNPQNINRKGAPKTKLLKEVLSAELHTESDGIDKLTAIINKLTTMAVNGDLNAIKEVLDRYAGKSVQHQDITTDFKPTKIYSEVVLPDGKSLEDYAKGI